MTDTDLFGNPVETTPAPENTRPDKPALNDMDAVVAVLERAVSDRSYMLLGMSERVYRITGPKRPDRCLPVSPATAWEAETVHQLIKARYLNVGGRHPVVSGAITGYACSVLVPKATQQQLTHWKHLARPKGWAESKYPA
ncbi:hypothetical protein JOF53_002879 [Crossiella equi]|uniref:Uncharacterized protein n=1 Tax=Crossiella equi TaxID=130796 RepID=A0ABS5ABP3_9PSEU|nr:hypothetical protein [Crossiella equi]MBP2474007.1 hypothetical protein [Crossiella equi]